MSDDQHDDDRLGEIVELLTVEMDALSAEEEALRSVCEVLDAQWQSLSDKLSGTFSVGGCLTLFRLNERLTHYQTLRQTLLSEVTLRAEFLSVLLNTNQQSDGPTIISPGAGVH